MSTISKEEAIRLPGITSTTFKNQTFEIVSAGITGGGISDLYDRKIVEKFSKEYQKAKSHRDGKADFNAIVIKGY